MPLFPSLDGLKGSLNNLNPLNIFNAEPFTASPATSSPPKGIPSIPPPVPAAAAANNKTSTTAAAGPGPASQAALAARRAASSPTHGHPSGSTSDLGRGPGPVPSPPKSCLREPSTGIRDDTSSNDSLDAPEPTRRKSSGNSVTILDPTKGVIHESARVEGRRRERPVSIGAGTLAESLDARSRRRRRRVPEDNYVIVRPAPSNSTKNAANLQVQLLVGPSRGRDRSQSTVSGTSTIRSASMASTSDLPPSPSKRPTELPSSHEFSSSENEAQTPMSEAPSIISATSNDESLPPSATDATIKRSASLKSSLSSKSSAAGSSASGISVKRVEPLFNLTVHNVMQPTVVTDGATDAKVAKFLKRSIDINGVGILEAAEVRLPHGSSHTLLPIVSADEHHSHRSRPVSMISMTHPLSPTMTASDDGHRGSLDGKRVSVDLKKLRLEVAQGEGGATKRFFGKMFKKRGSTDLSVAPNPLARRASRNGSAVSFEPPSPNPEAPHVIVKSPTGTTFAEGTSAGVKGDATFGTVPVTVVRRGSGTVVSSDGAITGLTSRSPFNPGLGLTPGAAQAAMENTTPFPLMASNRPVGYVWTVKRWSKRNQEGWAGQLVAAASAGLELVGSTIGGDEDEVVFEWVKMKTPPPGPPGGGAPIDRRLSTASRSVSRPPTGPRARLGVNVNGSPNLSSTESPTMSRTSLTLPFPAHSSAQAASRRNPSPHSSVHHLPLDGRPEAVRRVSASASPSRSPTPEPAPSDTRSLTDTHSIHSAAHTDDGDDSDPEESETPWACSVWVKSTGHRQLLATLHPAIHHPRVIAKMKIPQRLDPIALTDLRLGAADQRDQGKVRMAEKVKGEICLTEENLKDVVCVTGMWLVAREGFGGLGRKKGK